MNSSARVRSSVKRSSGKSSSTPSAPSRQRPRRRSQRRPPRSSENSASSSRDQPRATCKSSRSCPTLKRARANWPSRTGSTATGILTADMKRVVEEQRLGFVATVCPDGTPNLSPKGTTAVWDDDHLVFANIRSPGTLANLRQNANVEVNVVDPFLRKGYRFKGVAAVLESGTPYEHALAFYKARGSRASAIREIVMVRVESAHAIDSPAYDFGLTE